MAARRLDMDISASFSDAAEWASYLFFGIGHYDKNLWCCLSQGDAFRYRQEKLLAVQDLHRGKDSIYDDHLRARHRVHLLRNLNDTSQQAELWIIRLKSQ